MACIFLTAQQLSALIGRDCRSLDAGGAVDEFVRNDLARGFRSQHLATIVEQAPKLPFQFQVVLPTYVRGSYDFDRRRLLIAAPTITSILGAVIQGSLPELSWPLAEADARAFLTSASPAGKSLFLAVPLSIKGTSRSGISMAPQAWSESSGLPWSLEWQIVMGTPSLYADAQLTRRLHVFGEGAVVPDISLAAPPPQPSSNVQTSQPAASATLGADSNGTILANSADVASRWKLPTVKGLPLAPLPTRYPADAREPAYQAWMNAYGVLQLAHRPAETDQLALLRQACQFMTPEAQREVSGKTCRELSLDIGVPPQGGAEFVARDLVAAFQTRYRPSIVQSAPRLPFRTLVSFPLRIQTYDFTRNEFVFSSEYSLGSPGTPSTFNLLGRELGFNVPKLTWPQSEADPRPVLQEMQSGRNAPPFQLAFEVTITSRASRGGSSGPSADPLEFQAGPLWLYRDAQLARKLHEFGSQAPMSSVPGTSPAGPAASTAAAVPASPRSGTAADIPTNNAEAIRRWKLPSAGTLPLVPDAGQTIPVTSQVLENEGVKIPGIASDPAAIAWTRAMYALTLAWMPRPLTKVEAVRASCMLLSKEEQRALSGLACADSSNFAYFADQHVDDPKYALALQDMSSRFRSRSLPRIVETSPRLPIKVVMVVPGDVGPYKFDAGGFGLTAPLFGEAGRNVELPFLGSSIKFTTPVLHWPLPESEARLVLSRFPASAGQRKIYFGVEVVVSSPPEPVSEQSSPSSSANYNFLPAFAWRMDAGSISLYADPDLKTCLHSLGAPKTAFRPVAEPAGPCR